MTRCLEVGYWWVCVATNGMHSFPERCKRQACCTPIHTRNCQCNSKHFH